MSKPNARTRAMLASLQAAGGDLSTVALEYGVHPTSVYQAARRAGLNTYTLAQEQQDTVTVPRAHYLSLVAQVRGVGDMWAMYERMVATLTRELEARAA